MEGSDPSTPDPIFVLAQCRISNIARGQQAEAQIVVADAATIVSSLTEKLGDQQRRDIFLSSLSFNG